MRDRGKRGFTIIELLIVVAVIGVLAAIAIPNLLTALHRARQKRTMADMRAIALAWEARATDTNGFNAAGWSALTVVGASDLTGALVPTYIRALPEADGWSNEWHFYTSDAWDASTVAGRYQIASGGRNGALEPATPEGATTNFDCDIVYSNGQFIVWPEGVQTSPN